MSGKYVVINYVRIYVIVVTKFLLVVSTTPDEINLKLKIIILFLLRKKVLSPPTIMSQERLCVFYCNVLYFTIMYYTVLYCTIMYFTEVNYYQI